MSNRITPEDADLIAQRIVVRIARLIVAVALTLMVIWIVPVVVLYVFRAGTGTESLVFSVVGVAFAVLVILVLGRFWSKVLR